MTRMIRGCSYPLTRDESAINSGLPAYRIIMGLPVLGPLPPIPLLFRRTARYEAQRWPAARCPR